MPRTFYAKAILSSLLIFVFSLLLSHRILTFVLSNNYFFVDPKTMGEIALYLLLSLYAYSLSLGGWKNNLQYVLIPLPVALGIFIVMLRIDTTIAFITFVVVFALLALDTFVTSRIKDSLVNFNSRIVLRFSSKGIIFIFSVFAAVLVFLQPATHEFNLSGVIKSIAIDQAQRFIQPNLSQEINETRLADFLGEKGLPYDPEMFGQLSGLMLENESFVGNLNQINVDAADQIEAQIENLISPYKRFVPSLIALVVFGLFQFLGAIVMFVYFATVPVLYFVALKLNFIHFEYRQVEKEELSF